MHEITGVQRKGRRIAPSFLAILSILAFLPVLLIPTPSQAQASHLMDTPIARFVMKSEAGQALMRRVLRSHGLSHMDSAAQYDEFVKVLRSGRYAAEEEELLQAIRELADHADGFRRHLNPKASKIRNRFRQPRGEVAGFVEYLANHRLRLNQSWHPPHLRPRHTGAAIHAGKLKSSEESWSRLLAPARAGKLNDFKGATRDVGFLRTKAREIEATFSRYSHCIASQKGDASKARFREYLATDMAISSFFTAAGYITGTLIAGGEEEISIADFAFEVGQAAMVSVAYNFYVRGNLSFKRRWFRILMFGEARSVVDGFAYVYYTDARGGDKEHARAQAMERFVFNSLLWNPMPWGAVKTTAMYNLVNGLNCLYAGPNSKIFRNTKILRFFDSLGTAVLYFGVRHLYLSAAQDADLRDGELDIDSFIPSIVMNDPRPEDLLP